MKLFNDFFAIKLFFILIFFSEKLFFWSKKNYFKISEFKLFTKLHTLFTISISSISKRLFISFQSGRTRRTCSKPLRSSFESKFDFNLQCSYISQWLRFPTQIMLPSISHPSGQIQFNFIFNFTFYVNHNLNFNVFFCCIQRTLSKGAHQHPQECNCCFL